MVSLAHVKLYFNEELKASITVVYINGEKVEVLKLNYAGTNYRERAIDEKRSADTIQRLFGTSWMYHHSVPKCFSADT